MELNCYLGREAQMYKWAYANSTFQEKQICLALFDRRSALLDSLKCEGIKRIKKICGM